MAHEKLFQTVVVGGMSLASVGVAAEVAGCSCAPATAVDAGFDAPLPMEGADARMVDAPLPMEGADARMVDAPFPMEGPVMLDAPEPSDAPEPTDAPEADAGDDAPLPMEGPAPLDSGT